MIKAAKPAPRKTRKDGANQPIARKQIAPIKRRGGIPEHEPTLAARNLVMLSCAMGQTQAQMAAAIGISEDTLRKHYGPELADGGGKLLRSIAGNLAAIAQDRNHPKAVTAAIFWLKTKGGFKEQVATADPDNPDETVTFTINIGAGGPPKLPGDGAKVIDG